MDLIYKCSKHLESVFLTDCSPFWHLPPCQTKFKRIYSRLREGIDFIDPPGGLKKKQNKTKKTLAGLGLCVISVPYN